MNIGATRDAPPVVYLSPQVINPLSASRTPLTMSLPAKVDFSQRQAHDAVHQADKVQQVHRRRLQDDAATQQAQSDTMINVSGVAASGKVDVYV